MLEPLTALRELVALKRLQDRIEAAEAAHQNFVGDVALPIVVDEYNARKLVAWAAAFEIVDTDLLVGSSAGGDETPVAWMHDCTDPKNCDIGAVNGVIHDEVKRLWLEVKPKQVEHYTIPLYRRPAPAAACDDCAGTGVYGDGLACDSCKGFTRPTPAAVAQEHNAILSLMGKCDCEHCSPTPAAAADLTLKCLPSGVLLDAFGNTRVRYVRVICDGQTCVVTPEDAAQYVNDPEGHEAYYYTFADVYLSKEEFDGLPEFDGF
jgi:hypothetical protein